MNSELETKSQKSNFENLIKDSIKKKVEEIAPNFRKKNILCNEQLEKIIQILSVNLEISQDKALIGTILLFLQGAASAGAPLTMSIDLGGGKFIEKRNIITACSGAAGHQYIRRIAEALAIEIGEFAYNNNLAGELAYRINSRLMAETGESLNEREMAFCSSFSQAIPNLSEISSERLTRLLAEDYQKRFESTRKIRRAQDGEKSSIAKKKRVR